MIELKYIPKNIALTGVIFEQQECVDGIQSQGPVEGAAIVKGKDHNGDAISICMQPSQAVLAKHKRNSSTYIPLLGTGTHAPKIALYEQVTDVEDQPGLKKAAWRSALKEKRHEAEPMWGVGRMEYDVIENFDTERCKELRLELEDVKAEAALSDSPMAFDKEIEDLERGILAERTRARVRAVFYLHHEMVSMNAKDISRASVQEVVYDFLERFTKGGMIGGVLIRARKGNTVYANLSAEVRRLEDYTAKQENKQGQVLPPFDTDYIFNEFIERSGGRWMLNTIYKDPDMTVDFIPMIGVNCGNKSGPRYKEYNAYKKIKATYYDKLDQDKSVCRVMAARLSEHVHPDDDPRGEGNYILTSAHSFSQAIGNALELDAEYGRNYTINYDGVRFDKANANPTKRFMAMGSEVSRKMRETLMKKAG